MQQLPWWVSLVPVLAALVGGGPSMKARTDLDQWRRDRRLDAYAGLASAFNELAEAQLGWEFASDEKLRGADQEVDRLLLQVAHAVSRVQLLGPPPVRDAAEQLMGALETINPSPREMYEVLNAARKDLGER
jgi:hypothetical protein